jgi:hypothetical protein
MANSNWSKDELLDRINELAMSFRHRRTMTIRTMATPRTRTDQCPGAGRTPTGTPQASGKSAIIENPSHRTMRRVFIHGTESVPMKCRFEV